MRSYSLGLTAAFNTGTNREDFAIPFSLSNISNIKHFVAREAELAEIHTRLSSNGSRRTVVLYGLGGISKTQLSIAYTKRHKESYSAIFWLNIKDKDTLKQSFRSNSQADITSISLGEQTKQYSY